MRRFGAIFFILILTIPSLSYAIVWPLSGTSTPDIIDSDYGPRNISKGSTFHYGLDLRAYIAPVKSITTTTISMIVIAPTGTAGNYVGTSDAFRYLHLSKSTSNYEIKTETIEGKIITYIVYKDGMTTTVYASEGGLEAPEGFTTNSLWEGEAFAYSGNSGSPGKDKKTGEYLSYPYHLHIDKGINGSNPLRDLKDVYTASASTVSFIRPVVKPLVS